MPAIGPAISSFTQNAPRGRFCRFYPSAQAADASASPRAGRAVMTGAVRRVAREAFASLLCPDAHASQMLEYSGRSVNLV